jgi:hypothetical protein
LTKEKNDVSRLRLILPPNIMKTVLNLMRRRFVGGTALLIGVGMFIGWLRVGRADFSSKVTTGGKHGLSHLRRHQQQSGF